jgi:hypothetical protein
MKSVFHGLIKFFIVCVARVQNQGAKNTKTESGIGPPRTHSQLNRLRYVAMLALDSALIVPICCVLAAWNLG